jgi:predicted ester cyclase
VSTTVSSPPVQGPTPQHIDPAFARDFLGRLHAAVNEHDADAVAALCCEDIAWEDPAAPAPLHGRDAVRRFHGDTMFRAIPDVSIAIVDGPYLALDGQSIAVRLRIRGTMTGPLSPPGFAPTCGPIDFETAEFSRFQGGLLARHTVVLDMLSLARQIGAVPKAGSLADRIGVRLQHISARRNRRQRS